MRSSKSQSNSIQHYASTDETHGSPSITSSQGGRIYISMSVKYQVSTVPQEMRLHPTTTSVSGRIYISMSVVNDQVTA